MKEIMTYIQVKLKPLDISLTSSQNSILPITSLTELCKVLEMLNAVDGNSAASSFRQTGRTLHYQANLQVLSVVQRYPDEVLSLLSWENARRYIF